MKKQNINGSIVMYENAHGAVELRADAAGETIWATQAQIAQLFEVNVRTINEHLKNVFTTDELAEASVIRKFRITAKDGKRYLTHLYSLDAIIAVGYRVNSKKATKFRIWATGVLRGYLLRGHARAERTLVASPESLVGLREAIALLESKAYPGKLKGTLTLKIKKTLGPIN